MSENALESPCVSRNVSPASSSSTSPAASTMSPILVRRRLPRRCTPIMAALYFVRKRDSRTEQPMRGLPMATTTWKIEVQRNDSGVPFGPPGVSGWRSHGDGCMDVLRGMRYDYRPYGSSAGGSKGRGGVAAAAAPASGTPAAKA
eukprot:366400-Chlamydomonas_euryale.AAC.12